ncbi:MAG TPA: methyltransferase domain-containing protein [Mycobacterium sp.]
MTTASLESLVSAARVAFRDAEYFTPGGVLTVRGEFPAVEGLRVEGPPGQFLHFQSMAVDGPDVDGWAESAAFTASSWYGQFAKKFDARRLSAFSTPTGTVVHTGADSPAWFEASFERPLDLSGVRLRNVDTAAHRARGIKITARSRGEYQTLYDASAREQELTDLLTAALADDPSSLDHATSALVPIIVATFFAAYSEANRALDAASNLGDEFRAEFRALMSRTVLAPREREWTIHGPQRCFRFWSEQEKANYLREALEICDILKELTPKVCLGFGSALAIVRDGDFIPHDDDLDIIVGFDESEAADLSSALEMIEQWLRPRGFRVDGNFTAHRHVARPGQKKLDVFVGLFEGERISWYPSARRILDRDTMYPTSEATLFGMTCPLPGNPEAYLERVYGPQWRQPDPAFRHGWKRSEYVDLIQRGKITVGADTNGDRLFPSAGPRDTYLMTTSWRDAGNHPNAIGPMKYRHSQLTRAASSFRASRIGVVRHYANGKKVLDLGCVSHNFSVRSGGKARWLHAHVVEAAAECVGADYDLAGVKEMNAAGYDVVHVDIEGDLTPIIERGPFDVVIAGELIEHLPAPQRLLSAAREVLRPKGKLVITTPNPYALHRVRAGMRGVTWENVDHVQYLFPSGIAEMADRTGMELTRFGTVGAPPRLPISRAMFRSLQTVAVAARARRNGKRRRIPTGRLSLPLPSHWQSPLDVLVTAIRGDAMAHETAIYVLTKPDDA